MTYLSTGQVGIEKVILYYINLPNIFPFFDCQSHIQINALVVNFKISTPTNGNLEKVRET